VASNKKTIVLGLDYSQFDGGISAVNRKMALLDQEFKLASEMAQKFGSETEKLTLKQDQLSQKIALQNQKVEEAKKKYDAVISSQDKYGKKADDADKALLKERIALEKLNNELAANKEKLDQVAMSDADRKIALLQQEFELASAKTKSFATETEQLVQKSNMLSEKMSLQAQKVDFTRRAYEEARDSGEKNEQQLDALYSAYLQNQTVLENLNNELTENSQKIDASEKSTRSFGDTIRSVASAIGVDINPAVEALASKFDGISEAAGTAVLAIGTTIASLGKMTMETAKHAGEVEELAHKYGMTTDAVQEFQYAEDYLEISVDQIGSSIQKMTRNMDSARTGTGDAAEAFKKLHVRILESNGELRDSQDVFYNVIDALGSVRNETEKDALSMAIFGKSAAELNNVILEGSKGIQGFQQEAHNIGYVLDNETVHSFANADDSFAELSKKFMAAQIQISKFLLPILEKLSNLISGIKTPVLAGILVFGALAVVLGTVAFAAANMAIANAALSASNSVVGATGIFATAGMAPLLIILLAVAAAIALITAGVVGMKESMKSAKTAIADISESAGNLYENAAATSNSVNIVKKKSEAYGNTYYAPDYSQSSVGRGYASGTNYFPGGETWINDGGKPERVVLPRGTQIISGSSDESSGGNVYIQNITIPVSDLDEMQKVIQVFKDLRQKSRQGRVI
jgi:hypothetical protein